MCGGWEGGWGWYRLRLYCWRTVCSVQAIVCERHHCLGSPALRQAVDRSLNKGLCAEFPELYKCQIHTSLQRRIWRRNDVDRRSVAQVKFLGFPRFSLSFINFSWSFHAFHAMWELLHDQGRSARIARNWWVSQAQIFLDFVSKRECSGTVRCDTYINACVYACVYVVSPSMSCFHHWPPRAAFAAWTIKWRVYCEPPWLRGRSGALSLTPEPRTHQIHHGRSVVWRDLTCLATLIWCFWMRFTFQYIRDEDEDESEQEVEAFCHLCGWRYQCSTIYIYILSFFKVGVTDVL